MPKVFAFDVFISHSAKDKPVVLELARQLQNDGLRIWLDDWIIQPGDHIGLAIERGLEQSRTLLFAMSAHSFTSDWVALERHTILFRDPTNANRRFIPVRLDDYEIKDALKPFAYIDWRNPTNEKYDRLLAACRLPSVIGTESEYLQGLQVPNKLLKSHKGWVCSVAADSDGRRAITGSQDRTVRVWDLDTGRCVVSFEGHAAGMEGHGAGVLCVDITPDGRRAVSGDESGTVLLWDLDTFQCVGTLTGHSDSVRGVSVAADGRRAITGSQDRTVRVWNLDTGRCVASLEGHAAGVLCVDITPDGRRAVSGDGGGTARVWQLDTGRCVATLIGHSNAVRGVSVAADGRRVITGSWDKTARVWELSEETDPMDQTGGATRYTNAKVLLVGDSGVGKTGLALRLTDHRFEPTVSSDAAWASQLQLPYKAGSSDIEREIWLWDFAGQSDYRLIHQLFLDETSLAVLVFNPQSEEPFDGLSQWVRDLQRAARRPLGKLLVAGRCDRGGLMISRESIDQFLKTQGFDEYLETSARTGEGCARLRDSIVRSIDWERIPWTASPRIFKLLKEAILLIKDEGTVLLRIIELKQRLDMTLHGEVFTLAELRAVVGLLAGPGIVWQLEFGDFVLLQPERINAYAAAVIRSVRAHIEEIGCIAEQHVLNGDLKYHDMPRLPRHEELVVLRAMHQTFVDHGLCLREHTETGALLVFPSYFKRERPELKEHPTAFVSYMFTGSLDEIYATLVVKLHHTTSFEKDTLWRFAADFRTQTGRRVGLRMIKKGGPSAEIYIYFDDNIQEDTKLTFTKYVHEHIKSKDPNVIRTRHYHCRRCNWPVKDREAIQERLRRGHKTIKCIMCSSNITLLDLIETRFNSVESVKRVREMEDQARANMSNESRELVLVGHAFAIAAEADQLFRPLSNPELGFDGEIEFKDENGNPSGKRLYLQLNINEIYRFERNINGSETYVVKNNDHVNFWINQPYPVMLISRTSDGVVRWMDARASSLKAFRQGRKSPKNELAFSGGVFNASGLLAIRDEIMNV